MVKGDREKEIIWGTIFFVFLLGWLFLFRSVPAQYELEVCLGALFIYSILCFVATSFHKDDYDRCRSSLVKKFILLNLVIIYIPTIIIFGFPASYHIVEGADDDVSLVALLAFKENDPSQCLRIRVPFSLFPVLTESGSQYECMRFLAELKNDSNICHYFDDYREDDCLDEVNSPKQNRPYIRCFYYPNSHRNSSVDDLEAALCYGRNLDDSSDCVVKLEDSKVQKICVKKNGGEDYQNDILEFISEKRLLEK